MAAKATSSSSSAASSFAVTGASGELHRKSLGHKLGSVESWDDIAGIHGVLVFDESEAVHELDLGNLAGSMRREMRLNISLSDILGEVA
jgi:hypothetical protein